MHARRTPIGSEREFDCHAPSLDPQLNGLIPPRIRAAMAELLQDHLYAIDLRQDAWEFATEFERLRTFGVTDNDVRWMLGREWLHHARPSHEHPSSSRRLQHTAYVDRDSCFVLTKVGVEIAEALHPRMGLCQSGLAAAIPNVDLAPATRQDANASEANMPRWDSQCHRLYLGEVLVKEFRVPSPNQTKILEAFDEENWPLRIDDPLPNSGAIDPKERLRYTIKSLNKHQKIRAIRFGGDGSGEGILWESVLEGGQMGPDAASMRQVVPHWPESNAV